jgi:hypothetical protein
VEGISKLMTDRTVPQSTPELKTDEADRLRKLDSVASQMKAVSNLAVNLMAEIKKLPNKESIKSHISIFQIIRNLVRKPENKP